MLQRQAIRMSVARRSVYFVNRYFFPDESATSQLLSDLAFGLVEREFDVHVFCSRQLYGEAEAELPSFESVSGVTVHRLWTTRFGRGHLLGRAFDYLTFYASCALRLARSLRSGDIVVAKTDPPLISILAALVTACKGAKLVNWQQDVFPEVASHLGANPLPLWFDRLLRRMRDWSLRQARSNVVISSRMLEYFAARGIPTSRLFLIENWADPATISAKPAAASALRQRLGLGERFVVCYSGNLGRAHEYATLLAAADALRTDRAVEFLMIGGGAKMGAMQLAVRDLKLDNIRFLPYQPREQLADSLGAADVHLVSLLPALEGLIMPSKLYGVLAVGRPVIFIGDADGEVARVIRDAQCGVTVAVDAGAQLAAAIRDLQAKPAVCAAMGAKARETFLQCYTRNTALAHWIRVLEQV